MTIISLTNIAVGRFCLPNNDWMTDLISVVTHVHLTRVYGGRADTEGLRNSRDVSIGQLSQCGIAHLALATRRW